MNGSGTAAPESPSVLKVHPAGASLPSTHGFRTGPVVWLRLRAADTVALCQGHQARVGEGDAGHLAAQQITPTPRGEPTVHHETCMKKRPDSFETTSGVRCFHVPIWNIPSIKSS